MLSEKEIKDIAISYADSYVSPYFSLNFMMIKPSQFLEGYWDASYKVLNEMGNEIDEPLLVAINEKTGTISSMEELIAQNINNDNLRISNAPLKKKQ